MTFYQEPWPHLIIDDFFEPEVFEKMRKEIGLFIGGSKIESRQTLYKDFTSLPVTAEALASTDFESYVSHFKEHRPFEKLYRSSEVSFCLRDFSYPVHDEASSKVLSVVVYIAPDQGIGTGIHDLEKNHVFDVEWKPNRALIFAGLTGKTWHSYRSAPDGLRVTLNTFLRSHDLHKTQEHVSS